MHKFALGILGLGFLFQPSLGLSQSDDLNECDHLVRYYSEWPLCPANNPIIEVKDGVAYSKIWVTCIFRNGEGYSKPKKLKNSIVKDGGLYISYSEVRNNTEYLKTIRCGRVKENNEVELNERYCSFTNTTRQLRPNTYYLCVNETPQF